MTSSTVSGAKASNSRRRFKVGDKVRLKGAEKDTKNERTVNGLTDGKPQKVILDQEVKLSRVWKHGDLEPASV